MRQLAVGIVIAVLLVLAWPQIQSRLPAAPTSPSLGIAPHNQAAAGKPDAPAPTPRGVVDVVPGPVVAERLRAQGQLVTTALDQTFTVEMTRAPVFLFLGGEQVTLQAVGTVHAGVDLDRLRNATVKGDTVTVSLPPSEIFTVSLDEGRTFVADHALGYFARSDPALQDQARREAVRLLRERACGQSIDTQATADAEAAVTELLRAFGFRTVRVVTEPSRACQ